MRIIAAKRGELEALAEALGRDYPGVLVEKAEELAPDQDGEARRFDESLPQRMEELAAVADIEPSSSEKPENFEPTPAALGKPESQESDMTNPGFRQSSSDLAQEPTAARELAEFDARRQRMQRAKPGIPVRGLTNDGPGHERFLDPTAFASRRPD